MSRSKLESLEDENEENEQLWKKVLSLYMKEFEEVYKSWG